MTYIKQFFLIYSIQIIHCFSKYMVSKKILPFDFALNKVVWLLTLSDIFTWGLSLVINGFIGLYLAQRFGIDAIQMVGIGTAFFYGARVITQIPIGIISDKIKKDKDDITFLFFGNLLMGVPYLFFPSISSPLMFYFLQFIIGFGGAMNLVNWRKLFAANLQSQKEGLSYATYDSVMSFAMLIFSIFAGVLAGIGKDYFDLVMILVGLLTVSSGLWAILIFFDNKRKSM
ncbi:MAG: MFS transporter [Candidatus Dojkabacteria bacterium]